MDMVKLNYSGGDRYLFFIVFTLNHIKLWNKL
jgi:hypothetical protein